MDAVELKQLRRKQFVAMNVTIVAAMLLFVLWGEYIHFTVFWIGAGVLLLVQGLFILLGNILPLALALPFLRKLRDYENEKLGAEAGKRKKTGWCCVSVSGSIILSEWLDELGEARRDVL